MTEYELLDVMYTIFERMNDAATLYFSLVSAYLVLSFFIGERLTRAQLSIVNTLYIVWVIGVITSGHSGLNNVVVVINTLEEMNSTLSVQAQNVSKWSVYGFMAVQLGGLFASLYFMWHARHPKTE